MKKYVYFFDEVVESRNPKEILGGKGADLNEMTRLGLNVPFGFTITTEVCDYLHKYKKYPSELQEEIEKAIQKLEEKTGTKLGDKEKPLLLSVRSGAAISMPGMMDTVLNIGLNDEIVNNLAKDNEKFAFDCYRRLLQMFGNVVLNIPNEEFENIICKKKEIKGIKYDIEFTPSDLKEIVLEFKDVIKKYGKYFPDTSKEQLSMAIDAVFKSWNSKRAVKYREIHKIKGLLGTAVNVQIMVFGNKDKNSGTGVVFTRNPVTGDKEIYGEYLINAQGEDVVAGIRTPEQVSKLKRELPEIYQELIKTCETLEKHYRDMQDIEFTIQQGRLYILQTRTGKRTIQAAIKIAVDMVKEKLISKKEAIMRIDISQLSHLFHKSINPIEKTGKKPIGKGLPASPGAAVGRIALDTDTAILMSEKNEKIILVRKETSAEDIEGMHVSEGVLTTRGGMTSHAAVVARGMGKCCIVGCNELFIEEEKKKIKINNFEFNEGDFLTLDGSTGEIYNEKLSLVDPQLTEDFSEILKWAQEFKKLNIRTNADTAKDAEMAKKFGAEGIGLCRTEHMFFDGERINIMREMILAETEEERREALNKLLPYQIKDFIEILKIMDGLPVTIRLLDPPLHEFLPKSDSEIKEFSRVTRIDVKKIKAKISELQEFNPMLGFRGCRLGIVYPEISEMQARAIFEAALKVKEEGKNPLLEIELPNVIHLKEFSLIKEIIKKVAKETGAEQSIKYRIGTMIEFPRAALIADELAKEADFMSFGTNDLTQTILGFSRDDSGRFISHYIAREIFEKDPFQTIDQDGVGKIMKIAVEKARSTKPEIEIGICGEHGGDPESIKFCHKIGLSSTSCSPFRIPAATIYAARVAIEENLKNVQSTM